MILSSSVVGPTMTQFLRYLDKVRQVHHLQALAVISGETLLSWTIATWTIAF